MTSKGRAPEEWISFLLTCMDHTPAKPDWQKVAEETGAYKAGKFVNAAYVKLRKKYGPLPSVNGAGGGVPETPRSTKKRAPAADLGEDDEEEKPKRARKGKTPKKTEPKRETKEEVDDKAINGVKAEDSTDELDGDVTVNGGDDDDDDDGDQD